MDTKKIMDAVSSTKVPSLLITSTKMSEDIHTSKQLVPMLEYWNLSQATDKDYPTLSSPTSHVVAVHTLSLQFRLVGIDYTESLENKSSNSYRKLEKEVRLTVILLLGTQYQVQDFILDQVGNSQGDLDITAEAYINTSIHVDVRWVLEALRGLVNYSVDLSSLSVNGSRLGLQVFPFSFLVTNREVNKKLLDRSTLEHRTLARDLSDVDYLAASSLQVDPFSFTVAGDGLEPPFTSLGVPGYGVALIVMCALAIIAIPVLNLLPKILGRKDKIIITRAGDLEAGVETFELDNPGFHSIVEPYGLSLSGSNPWAEVDVSQPRALSDLTPVVVQCGEAQVVVTVNRDLFGTGKLIQAADLSLGSSGCQYTSVDDAKEIVIFEAGLHECGSILYMTQDSLVYGISLYYKPTPGSNSVIVRTNPAEVPIECHYPRKDNVSSKAIKPTWVPFSSTISAEEKLAFSLRLMKDDWSSERPSNRYHLGDTMHIQADVHTENHVALRLFIDNCVATPNPDRDSSPQYSIIDFNGCLIDGRLDDSTSAFVSPRIRQDSLRFTVDAFRFSGDARDLIYITCHLKVSAADQSPDPLNKACSYNKARNTWSPVEGIGDICRCCEARNCGQSQRTPQRWRGFGGRFRRDVLMHGDDSTGKAETDLMVGPVILEAQKTSVHFPEDQRTEGLIAKGASELVVHIMIGLTVATAVLTLASVSLVCFVVAKKSSRSNI
ncbi:zona pellucida sperm-binding protein 3-like [Tiliqua scincoides]|uniref:zona pellucida sperm-binding protein 3-like n=1 Tax=Tiliqua scincoides TaxID=71010 RepID=UPI003462323B